jgi:hypothetical protein
MKSFLKRKIRQLIWWAEDDRYEDEVAETSTGFSRGTFFNSDYREFRIFKADNGNVVEVYNYRKNKEAENNLYIIKSDTDIGQELSKILMLEELRSK